MLIAVVIAVPGGLAIAFYLSQYASDRVRRKLKPILEILAGVPTVVFGFFAINFIGPNIAAKIWVFSDGVSVHWLRRVLPLVRGNFKESGNTGKLRYAIGCGDFSLQN